MKKSTKIALAGLLGAAGLACSAQAQVVISEVYGAGGAAGGMFGCGVYNFDYVQLFNRGTSPVTLTSASLQYAAVTGSSWTVLRLPANLTIQPGQYFLVQVNSNAVSTDPNCAYVPIAPDFVATPGAAGSGTFNISGTVFKLALVDNQTNLGAVACPLPNTAILDFVGVGNGTNGVTGIANCAEGQPASGLGNQFVLRRNNNGCQDTNNNVADFARTPIAPGEPAPRNAASPTQGCNDCNNNGIPDNVEIANNPSLDCNSDGIIDSCQLTSSTDCNNDGILDVCQLTGNDCDNNGRLDSCDIADSPYIDFNNNGQIDACETPGPGEDCNTNGLKDSWELRAFTQTDVNNNGTLDSCEGAVAVFPNVNATVQVPGVRAEANGIRFFNVQGPSVSAGTNAGYGALRFNLGAPVSAGEIYLYLVQNNTGFTSGAVLPTDPDNIEVFYTNNDTLNITPPATGQTNVNALFANFATDYADRQSAGTYRFVRGINTITPFANTTGSGTVDAISLSGAGEAAIRSELSTGNTTLTMVLRHIDGQEFVSATFNGLSNAQSGQLAANARQRLVVFPGVSGPVCDSLDYNQDGDFPTPLDLEDFIAANAGNICSTCSTDLDFNNDGDFPTPLDIEAFISVNAGGPCL